MKKVVVLGHFAFGQDKSNGQTIKTKIVTRALEKEVGPEQIDCKDTVGGWRFMLRLPFVALQMMLNYRNIIFLPAYKGARVIIPLLVFLNLFFHRKLHYVVIGGWLPDFVQKHPLLKLSARRLDHIYVETQYMRAQMDKLHFHNVKVMPNFKELNIIGKDELPVTAKWPLRLCTFSRVMPEKGIEDAIEAVVESNRQLGKCAFTLDIYGMIEPGREQWFENLMFRQPLEIQYGGIVPFSQSTSVLRRYFTLLFPTRFQTEGFAGTLIDAMAAGLPPIASNCPSNEELIRDGETGMLFKMNDVPELVTLLVSVAQDTDKIIQMRPACLQEASKYLPKNMIRILIDEIG